MLPLIPAVLLAILHGPAGVERLAADGRLPAALRVLASRHFDSARAAAEGALAPVQARAEADGVASKGPHVSSSWAAFFPLIELGCIEETDFGSSIGPVVGSATIAHPARESLKGIALDPCRCPRDGPFSR